MGQDGADYLRTRKSIGSGRSMLPVERKLLMSLLKIILGLAPVTMILLELRDLEEITEIIDHRQLLEKWIIQLASITIQEKT